MKRTLLAVISLMVAVLVGACGEYAVDYVCVKDETQCEGNVLYTCMEVDGHSYWEKEVCNLGCYKNDDDYVCKQCDPENLSNKSLCEMVGGKAIYSVCSDNFRWNKGECLSNKCDAAGKSCACPDKCVNGCNEKGTCIPLEGCASNNLETGACICVEGSGNRIDGYCECSAKCVNGCDEYTGSCKVTEKCTLGNHDTGACKCVEGSDNKIDGYCSCPTRCVNGCDEHDGSCKPLEGCIYNDKDTGACICFYGHKPDGRCVCPETCFLGCDENGLCIRVDDKECEEFDLNTGACICENGNDKDGRCLNVCIDKKLFNPGNGSCSCSEACEVGCFENGLCKEVGNCNVNEDCNDYDSCRTDRCYCNEEKSRCALNDANHNNMYDYIEGKVDNKDCWTDADCVGAAATGEKFCDNAMGYKCSVRCSKDADCVDGFICRSSDGRCVSEFFTTVWDKSVRGDKVEFSISSKKNCNIDVYWDWKDDVVNIPEHYEDCPSSLSHDYSKYTSDKLDDTDVVIKIKGDLNGVSFYKKGCFLNEGINIKGEVCDGKPGHEDGCEGVYTFVESSCNKIIEVKSFGLVGFLNLNHGAFENCYMLKKLSEVDIPDPNKLNLMSKMFMNTCLLDEPLEHWDVSNVTRMEKAFWMSYCSYKATQQSQTCTKDGVTYQGSCLGIARFNRPLNHWNVSKVEYMSNMFTGLSNFNQPLDRWDVSNVKEMEGMFGSCYSFNQPLDKWNVSKVQSMKDMFYATEKFDQDLSGWKLDKGVDVDTMFNGSGISEANYCKIYKAWKSIAKNVDKMGPFEDEVKWIPKYKNCK